MKKESVKEQNPLSFLKVEDEEEKDARAETGILQCYNQRRDVYRPVHCPQLHFSLSDYQTPPLKRTSPVIF